MRILKTAIRRRPIVVRVFVSHSRDGELARQICTGIEGAGAEWFLDEARIEAGDVFERRILEALRNCTEHVILLSPRSVQRPYVWMEIGAAWVLNRRIVGVLNGISLRDLRAIDGLPALILSLNLIDLRNVNQFFDELRRRVAEARN
jgi:hypothetical protein